MHVLAASATGFSWTPVLVTLITALFGGGGTIAAILKYKPGAGKVIAAAQGAVVIQTGVLDSLYKEIARLNGQVEETETENEELREKLEDALARCHLLELELTEANRRGDH